MASCDTVNWEDDVVTPADPVATTGAEKPGVWSKPPTAAVKSLSTKKHEITHVTTATTSANADVSASVETCSFFLRGVCGKGDECPFGHPPAAAPSASAQAEGDFTPAKGKKPARPQTRNQAIEKMTELELTLVAELRLKSPNISADKSFMELQSQSNFRRMHAYPQAVDADGKPLFKYGKPVWINMGNRRNARSGEKWVIHLRHHANKVIENCNLPVGSDNYMLLTQFVNGIFAVHLAEVAYSTKGKCNTTTWVTPF